MLERDLGVAVGNRFQIGRWSEQGVLLLNTTLSVRAGEPESHKGLGWQTITDRYQCRCCLGTANNFFALGCSRRKKVSWLIARKSDTDGSAPITAERLSRVFDCAHFSATNQWLASQGEQAIRWESAC